MLDDHMLALPKSFNRTSVELKRIPAYRQLVNHATFNRTSVELKPILDSAIISFISPF